MDDLCPFDNLQPGRDFVRLRRIPEGGCELLTARYSRQAFGRHSHDSYALGVISEGAERLFYRGSHALGGPGSVVTLSPGEMHDGLPGHEQGWAYRMLYLDPQWVSRHLLRDEGEQRIHLFREAMQHSPALARRFVEVHQRLEGSRCALERETLLLDLLTRLFERNGASVRAAAAREAVEPWAVRQVRQKLDEDFAVEVSLQALATLVNLDPLYLIRVFKKSVGIAPHSYQIQKRIARVQQLLRLGIGLAEASAACGFFDQSHMSRAFRKVVGITPGRFREA